VWRKNTLKPRRTPQTSSKTSPDHLFNPPLCPSVISAVNALRNESCRARILNHGGPQRRIERSMRTGFFNEVAEVRRVCRKQLFRASANSANLVKNKSGLSLQSSSSAPPRTPAASAVNHDAPITRQPAPRRAPCGRGIDTRRHSDTVCREDSRRGA
jgi:hypothetical protein